MSAAAPTEARLSESVSVFTYGGETLATSYGANAVAFFGDGATVLVDPFVSPVQAEGLDGLLHARTAAPVTHVVLTHHHTDHALGAGYFAAKGAEVIAHEKAAARMAEEHPGLIAERRRDPEVAHLFESAATYVPSRIISDTFLIEARGLRLEVFHPGHGHTPGDLCVLAPAPGVLVAGDLVSTGYHPNLEDADVTGMRAALGRLRLLPFSTLVPGHGPPSRRESLEDQLRYLDVAAKAVRRALESGTEGDARAAMTRAFPSFRLEIVLPALVAALR
ncbi:MAG TPA: MBL fold metallo-hydrolase [Thermoanaerobaculia bacterium]|nr:MBL fold metallo-hydrolase [Thermoanaerobaculia bacterium]